MKDNNEMDAFRIKDADPNLVCTTRNLVPRRRDIERKDIDNFVAKIKKSKKEEIEKKKKVEKKDDIEVIAEK